MRTLVVPLALLFAVPAAAADVPAHRATGDLAVRARHILTTYCGHCHGEKDAAGRLNVFDHKATTAHAQPAPFAARDRALVVEFVKDGSMPLGDHPRPTAAELAVLEKWVATDAPEYPKRFDDAGAAAAVLADLADPQAVKAEDVKYTRYAAFTHLLAPAKSSAELDAALTRLADAEGELHAAVKPAGAAKSLVPVDAAATVFRYDLRDAEWHHTGLFKPKGDLVNVYDMIPFDLIWLENPHAVGPAPPTAEAREAVAGMNPHHRNLTPNPFRPQLFVRGDWLKGQLRTGDKPTPLAEELAALVALGRVKEGDPKRKSLTGPKPRPFAVAKSDPPAPVTSWYTRETGTPATGLTLAVTATLNKNPLPEKLPDDADIEIAVTVHRPGVIQLAYLAPTDFPRGWTVTAETLTAGGEPKANAKTVLATNPTDKFALTAAGVQHYVVFAAPTAFKPVVVQSAHPTGNYPIFRVFPPDATVPVTRHVLSLTVAAGK